MSSGVSWLPRGDNLMYDIYMTLSIVSAIIFRIDHQNACRLDGITVIILINAFCFLASWKSSSVVPILINAVYPSGL